MKKLLASSLAVLCTTYVGFAAQQSQTPRGRVLYATTQDNRLAKFGSENPNSSVTTQAFTGLAANEIMLGLDFGPRDGKLYGISNQNQIYTINPSSAIVTKIGSSAFNPALSGFSFGMDFNPTVNRVRVHSNLGFNARINQETGSIVDFDAATAGIQTDLNLNYSSTDKNANTNPSIVATAYTNSNATATTTTLYAIDSRHDTLVSVSPPNDGKLSTIGALGIDTSAAAGFDISGASDGTALAALTTNGISSLYTINLTTGKATIVETIGEELMITGLAIAP